MYPVPTFLSGGVYHDLRANIRATRTNYARIYTIEHPFEMPSKQRDYCKKAASSYYVSGPTRIMRALASERIARVSFSTSLRQIDTYTNTSS